MTCRRWDKQCTNPKDKVNLPPGAYINLIRLLSNSNFIHPNTVKWYHGIKLISRREKLVYTSFSLGSLWFKPSLKFRFWALLLEEILHKGYTWQQRRTILGSIPSGINLFFYSNLRRVERRCTPGHPFSRAYFKHSR